MNLLTPLEAAFVLNRKPSPVVLPTRPSLEATAVGTLPKAFPLAPTRHSSRHFGIKSVISKTIAVTYERIVLTPPFPGVLVKNAVNPSPLLTTTLFPPHNTPLVGAERLSKTLPTIPPFVARAVPPYNGKRFPPLLIVSTRTFATPLALPCPT